MKQNYVNAMTPMLDVQQVDLCHHNMNEMLSFLDCTH